MGFLTGPTQWFVNRFVKRPRFWTKQEWKKMTHKEKLWVWYKHHWTMIGHGSSELGQILSPFQSALLYGSVVFVAAQQVNEGFNLGLSIPQLFSALVTIVGFLMIVNFWLQWSIGNWKDKKDFIALEQEIANRRNKVFREFRNIESKQRLKGLYRNQKKRTLKNGCLG